MLLPQGAECNMVNIFWGVSHILHDSSRAIRRIARYEENICQFCTRQQEKTTLPLNPCCKQNIARLF